MVLLGDEAEVDACFSPLEIVLILTQDRCMFCTECTLVLKSFWTHPMELLGEEAQVESRFSLFGDSANVDAR